MNPLDCETLETERLLLRKFEASDALDVYNNYATDEKVLDLVAWQKHKDINDTRNILNGWIAKYEEDYYYCWAIYLKTEKKIIGHIRVVNNLPIFENCEIGYSLGSKWWGNGYMTEALRKVLEFLLLKVEYHIVTASHDPENVASGKVMVNAGMKYDALLRQRYKRKNGTFADLKNYSITKEEL